MNGQIEYNVKHWVANNSKLKSNDLVRKQQKMCQFGCFGCFGQNNNKSKKQPYNRLPTAKETEAIQSEGGITTTDIEKSASHQFSSPSRMKTTELTEIFKIPSRNFMTVDDVIAANGFEIEQEVGKGSYAVVYKAHRLRDNFTVACKVMNITNASRNQSLSVKNELFILERINHPHIIKLYKHFIIEGVSSRFVYIFMQYAESESLSVYMRKIKNGLEEPVAKKMFAQMVSAVNHMHSKGIAHRDIKMGNVLLDKNYDCLVTDFGLSRVAYRPSKGGKIFSNKFCGTVPYMAPEILLTKEYQVEYDPFVADIWALGVILFCIVNRGYPFVESANMLEQQMAHKIKFGRKMCFEPTCELIDLFYRLLDPNVDQRIKMDQLMIHPWVVKDIQQIDTSIVKNEKYAIPIKIRPSAIFNLSNNQVTDSTFGPKTSTELAIVSSDKSQPKYKISKESQIKY